MFERGKQTLSAPAAPPPTHTAPGTCNTRILGLSINYSNNEEGEVRGGVPARKLNRDDKLGGVPGGLFLQHTPTP